METKKVKIRVAIVVDSSGDYSSCGWSKAPEDLGNCFEICYDGLSGDHLPEARYVIEAEIDIPDRSAFTVEGTATRQTNEDS